MKAERRHELETNDLAKKIIQAPDYFKLYGGRIALGVVVLVALGMLVNYKIQQKRTDLVMAQMGVAEAREAVGMLASPNQVVAGEQLAMRRRQNIADATAAIERVNEHSEDSKFLAQAAVLRGDLYWTIANLTDIKEAATRPALAIEPKADVALEQARAAYKRVVSDFADQQLPLVTARFGLAAVAENQGQWDEAKRQYDAVNGDAGMPAVYKTQAAARLRFLGQLQKGVYVAVAATQPVAGATTGPTSQGTTR